MKVILNNQEYSVNIEYKDIKNMYLRIIDDKTLKVTCHPFIAQAQIENFIHNKKAWLSKATQKVNHRRSNTKMSIINNEIYFLGNKYPLVYEQKPRKAINFDNSKYYIAMPSNKVDDALKMVYKYHQNDLLKILNELRVKWDRVMDDYRLPHPVIKVKYLKGRHGQCVVSKNEITISQRLIHFDKAIIDAVLWHEYCHLVVPNHSKRFYELVESRMPNYHNIKNMIQ